MMTTPPARDVVFARPLRAVPGTEPWTAELIDATERRIAMLSGETSLREALAIVAALNAPTPDKERVIEVMRKAQAWIKSAYERPDSVVRNGYRCHELNAEIDAALTAPPEGRGTEWARLKEIEAVASDLVNGPPGPMVTLGEQSCWDQAMREKFAALLQSPRGKGE